MRRRKLLISIGALGAGGTAAFGTEAFTNVEAERSVDVTVADDQNAFLAIQPLQGNNANQYVTTESDNTIALNFDSESDASGSGVNQDAVTQVEDLFKIINQGTQEVSVFFEDDSDAVTFRVTRSTDTTTNGSSGQSLEGADKSVELGTGEQIAVGITIDTFNNDVSGSLIDNVTIQAKSEDSAPQQSIPEPQYVVTPDPGDSPNRFSDIPSALSQAEEGAVVGIEGSLTNTDIADDGTINVGTNDLTLTGFEGTPTVETGDNQLELAGDGVRLLNIDVTTNGGGGGAGDGPFRTIEAVGNNVTIDGVKVTVPGEGASATAPVIYAGKDDNNSDGGSGVTITNSDVRDAPISVKSSGSVTVTGNNVEGSPSEGIFSFGSAAGSGDYTVENNRIRDSGAGGNGQEQDIKFDTPPNSINGQSSEKDQLQSLLTENDISVAAVDGVTGTKVSSQSNRFSGLQDAINNAGDSETGNQGLTLVESGTFAEDISLSNEGLTVKSVGNATPTVRGQGKDGNDVSIDANNITIDGLEFLPSTNTERGQGIPNEKLLIQIKQGVTGLDFLNNRVEVDNNEVDTRYDEAISFEPGGGFEGHRFEGNELIANAAGKSDLVRLLFINPGDNKDITIINNDFRGDLGGGSGVSLQADNSELSNNLFDLERNDDQFGIVGVGEANDGDDESVTVKDNRFTAKPAPGTLYVGNLAGGGLNLSNVINNNNFIPNVTIQQDPNSFTPEGIVVEEE